MAASAWAESDPRKSILVLGDSLSAGYGIALEESWVSLLQDRLTQQGYGYRVVNASVSGETTEGGLTRLPAALRKHRPDLVLIELGGNDGLRGIPVRTFKQNLQRMVELSREAGAEVLLLGIRIPPNYGPVYTRAFESVYQQLAHEFELALVDFLLAGVALDPSLMQADGIHPTADAQPVLLDNVWPMIEPCIDGPG